MSTVTRTPSGVPQLGEGTPPRRGKASGASRTGGVGEKIFNGFSHLFLVVWAIMVIYPLLWVVMSSLKDDSEVIRQPLSLIPKTLHWENFSRAWDKGHIGSFFFNTIVVL